MSALGGEADIRRCDATVRFMTQSRQITGLAQTQTNDSQRNPTLPMPQSGFEC